MKKKAITIEDVALMVGKGFLGVDKKFDKIDKRLDGVDKRLDAVDKRLDNLDKRLNGVEQKLDNLDENIQTTRRDVLDIGDRFVPRFEFDNLLIRFNKLEEKIRSKMK